MRRARHGRRYFRSARLSGRALGANAESPPSYCLHLSIVMSTTLTSFKPFPFHLYLHLSPFPKLLIPFHFYDISDYALPISSASPFNDTSSKFVGLINSHESKACYQLYLKRAEALSLYSNLSSPSAVPSKWLRLIHRRLRHQRLQMRRRKTYKMTLIHHHMNHQSNNHRLVPMVDSW